MKKIFLIPSIVLLLVLFASLAFVSAAVADTKSPVITMLNPSGSPYTTKDLHYVISGIVSDQGGSGVKLISVNGAVVFRGSQNAVNFKYDFSLDKGYNYIKVASYDVAGNYAEKKFTIIRQ